MLGKGGVGRSTVAAALGACFASRGERTLLVEWTLGEPIAPWFGLPPAGHAAVGIAPRLSVMNYTLAETMREYFVDHLGMRRLHDKVIASRHVQVALRAAPGFEELFFLGRLFWLSELAAKEGAQEFDRIVVDAPATGHAASLLGLPAHLASLHGSGLFELELKRVRTMLGDASWTSAVVVALAEELACEETKELVPLVTRELSRPPLALLVNRSVAAAVPDASGAAGQEPAWLETLAARLPETRALFSELRERRQRERMLETELGPRCALGALCLGDGLFGARRLGPRELVQSLGATLAAWLPA